MKYSTKNMQMKEDILYFIFLEISTIHEVLITQKIKISLPINVYEYETT